MPNNCYFAMNVTGKAQNIMKFYDVLLADYHCTSEDPVHFWRVFSAEMSEQPKQIGNMGLCEAVITGDCAWSVYACMCNGTHTYNSTDTTNKGTTLLKQSKELNLAIEVYSSEPGIGFQEHYLYVLGEERVNETTDYSEFWITNEEELAEFNEEYHTNYTMDDVDENGDITVGGFGDWVFEDAWQYFN